MPKGKQKGKRQAKTSKSQGKKQKENKGKKQAKSKGQAKGKRQAQYGRPQCERKGTSPPDMQAKDISAEGTSKQPSPDRTDPSSLLPFAHSCVSQLSMRAVQHVLVPPTRVPFFSRGVGVGSLLRVLVRSTRTMYLCIYVHSTCT